MSSDDIKITFNNNQENNKKVSVKFETINDIPQETKSSIITDKEGNYNLIGVVPGRYLLRFT